MKPLGDSHLIERGNSLKNNNIFLRIKQFIQKNKCNLCKKTIFLCKIAVALRMECVDLSTHLAILLKSSMGRTPYGVRGFKLRPGVIYILDTEVALRMECVDLSFRNILLFTCFSPSHSVWSVWM